MKKIDKLQKEILKVYCPCSFDTGVKGYWIDKGKLYCDDILIQSVNPYSFQRIKNNLFKRGELAVFYIENDNAYIESKDNLQVLKNCKRQTLYNPIIEKQIKALCDKYGGFTLFKYYDNTYKIEVWEK